ncbi:MAG TPA: metallophosphoesterase [Acidobacteriota bacterium]|nr:metallophosphoesterase [Acidobacteriota bacterium]
MQKKTQFLKVLILTTAFMLLVGSIAGFAEPWKFGVIADTQWLNNDDGKNPNTVAADVIKQVDREFILKGVRFVVAVGDTVDVPSLGSLDTRALFAQDLYNAGIGFYPLRGNHESEMPGSGPEFIRIFPQNLNGLNNLTPSDINPSIGTDAFLAPDSKVGFPFKIGSNFNSPSLTFNGVSIKGLTYSFDYENARFILLDQFDNSGNTTNTTIPQQQNWITQRLSDKKRPDHAFVFAHKGLITENHADGLFGPNPASDPASTDAFIASLANHGVQYLIGGHDHMHNRAVVSTTDGKTAIVHELICASDSNKFYTPVNPSNDTKYDNPAREIPLSQDLYQIGYYIVTVDGPHVTFEYYGVPSGQIGGLISATPVLSGNWEKRETFGYSLNGAEFLVGQGQSYTIVQDSFRGTTASILAGINGSTAQDAGGRRLTKAIYTGWSKTNPGAASDILRLGGMAKGFGTQETDVYVLSMSYEGRSLRTDELKSGLFGLATRNGKGNWINAVTKNFGGVEKQFVVGPWTAGYGLGTYGIDPSTHTAWAVINFNGEFTVAGFGDSDEPDRR